MLRLVRGARVLCRTLCLWLWGWRWVAPGQWCKLHGTTDTRRPERMYVVVAEAYMGTVNATRWAGNSPRCVRIVGATLEAFYMQNDREIDYVVRYDIEVLNRPNYTAETTEFHEVFE